MREPALGSTQRVRLDVCIAAGCVVRSRLHRMICFLCWQLSTLLSHLRELLDDENTH